MKDKINLGCGKDIRKNYLNVDFESFPGVDKIYNLNKIPYPFKANSFSLVLMRNILEHLNDSYAIMLEIYRISKPNAVVHIRVPHFSSNNTWEDLQHKRGYGLGSFTNSNISDKFELLKYEIEFSPYRFFMIPLAKFAPFFYEKHLAYIFPATDLVVKLRVKK